MLKAIGWVLKLAFFAVFVLVVANYLRWDGKTISDQVRTHLAHADPVEISHEIRTELRGIGDHVTGENRKGRGEKARAPIARASTDDEEISPSERQKLRALIRELNSSRGD